MKFYNRLIFTAAAFALALAPLSAQSKLSRSAHRLLATHEAAPASRSDEPERVLATIELHSPEALDSLRALGADVKTTFGSFAIVALPLDQARRAAGITAIKAIDFGSAATPLLDEARKPTNVDEVHDGSFRGLPHDFTGKEVVVGIVDQGFDPLHPAFLDADGEPRVKLFAKLSKGGDIKTYSGRDGLNRVKTDETSSSHATHVTGIAAGGHIDNAIYPEVTDQGPITSLTTGPLPYYGVATDADIIMAGGSLELSAVLLGVSTIVDKSHELGYPAVINMSLGLGIGPHTGQTTFSRALAELGKEAIIVVAAGNEGNKNVSVDHTMDASRSLTVGIDMSAAKSSSSSKQAIEIHGPKDCDMSLYLTGYSKSTGEQVFRIKAQPFTASGEFVAISQAQLGKFTTFFGGRPKLGIGLSEFTETPMAYIDLEGVYTLASNTDVILAFDVKANEGSRILAWANESSHPFYSGGIPGINPGSSSLSISDLATGENILTVGAFNTRENWPALDKNRYGYKGASYPYLCPSDYSSYGILPDGRSLPHVSAPGTVIISAMNRYYTNNKDAAKFSACVSASNEGGYDAYYGNMMGTSMATPFMTGVVALWLQANPALSIADIHKIVEATSIKDDIYYKNDLNATREGAGRVDALAGIKMALEMATHTGIADVAAPAGEIITSAPGSVTAFFPGARSVSLSIFTVAGARVTSASSSSSEATVDTSALAPGIYIVRATDGRSSLSRKIAIN